MSDSQWDAVVLAGGAGTRLGGVSKPDLVVAGTALLERTLQAVAGASTVVQVGGPRREGVTWTVEDPPGFGPAAALAAGVTALGTDHAPWVVVLGVDTPRAADAVPLLIAARTGDGAWLVDDTGREQPLIAVYRTQALVERIRREPMRQGGSLWRMVEGLELSRVEDPAGLSRDVDTWEDAQYWEGVL